MEAPSIRRDHGTAGSRRPRNNSEPQNMPDLNHGMAYTGPRSQPVDIVIPSAAPSPQEDHVLKVVQQPEIAKVAAPKEKVRSPLDPPLVVELSFHSKESNRTYLSSPFFFGNVELLPERQPRPTERQQFQSTMIGGSLVSSLHKVRLDDSLDHAFFVFGDLNIKVVGRFLLKFTLFEMHKRDNGEFHVVQLGSIFTNTFRAYASKDFPGQMESTQLSKQLCDQGIKLRIRKETIKRKAHSSDWRADYSMNPQHRMSIYSRGYYDPFQSGHGRNDQRHERYRYSPPYPIGAVAVPDRHLPQISALPPASTLPHPSTHSDHASGLFLLPATAFPRESSLPPVMRSHFTSMSTPEHHGSRSWSHSSGYGDSSSYITGREQNSHEYGNPSGLEHYQNLPHTGRFSPNDVAQQEMPSSLSHDDHYGRRPSIPPSYDHSSAYSRHETHPGSSVRDASRVRRPSSSAMLPPIVPGSYGSGTQLGSAPSSSFEPETAFDESAVQPREPPNHLDRTIGDEQQDTISRRPGPPV